MKQLPENKVCEINDYDDFLPGRMDDIILFKGIQELMCSLKAFDFLKD
jgi:hypothetical protein